MCVLEYFELQYVELYLQCQECFNSCAFGLVKVSELFFLRVTLKRDGVIIVFRNADHADVLCKVACTGRYVIYTGCELALTARTSGWGQQLTSKNSVLC